MGKNLSILSAAILVFASAGVASAQVQPTGTWAAESGGDYLYSGFGATDGTYLYVVGGYQNSFSYPHEYYGRVRRYDPVANSWTNYGMLSTGVNSGTCYGTLYHAGDYYNGRIYIFGGLNYTGTIGTTTYTGAYTNAIRYFNISTQTITTVSATLTATTYYHAAVTMGDRIYVSGGVSSNAFYVFNPTTNTISTGPTMPGYLYYHGMAAVPAVGKVYALGGIGTASYAGYCYEYTPGTSEPAQGSWATRSPMNTNTTGGGSAANMYYVRAITLNNRIYVTGYNSSNAAQNNCLEYNALTDSWTQRATSLYGHYNGHAFVAINGKGYSYGGYPSYTVGEEFTPPTFGVAPNYPTNLAQAGSSPASALQAQADSSIPDGWTNNQISFSANVTDPDAGQQVRFRVQVKPAAAAWTQTSQVTTLQTPLGAQGTHSLNFNIPADGGFDWRWRVEDSFGNSVPAAANTWVDAFSTQTVPNTLSPDFRSDQVPPADPVAFSPSNVDIQVPDPVLGDVTLNWTESTDNGPVSGISYELQVARDGGFLDIEAQLFSTAGTSSYPITLTVSRYEKFWRIRAKDIGGNLSNWSNELSFRVTHNDGVDHSAGDAKKYCGFSATAVPALGSSAMGAVILLLSAGLCLRRRACKTIGDSRKGLA